MPASLTGRSAPFQAPKRVMRRRPIAAAATASRIAKKIIIVVVGVSEDAVAVETRAHPDRYRAHLEKWRALHGAGWRVRDAYPSRFDHDPVRAAMELAHGVAR